MKRPWMAGVALAFVGLGFAAGQTPATPPLQISLGRPEALDDSDVPVTPVSSQSAAPVIRMQSPEPFQTEAIRSRPMPVGPTEGGFASGGSMISRSSSFATE